MSLISDHERSLLQIERMIFHVVGPNHPSPILLEEIAPVAHADFFLERIRSASRGNLFAFRNNSFVHDKLLEIERSPSNFAQISKDIAFNFNRAHVRAASDGAFFVFRIKISNEYMYALLNYDNDDVVRYVFTKQASKNVAKLDRFHETFVRKPEALQKVALIRLCSSGGQISVRDRSNPFHISDYFANFLDVQRVLDAAALTERLATACITAAGKHKDLLPEPIRKAGVSHIYGALRALQTFDPTDPAALASVFGTVGHLQKPSRHADRRLIH